VAGAAADALDRDGPSGGVGEDDPPLRPRVQGRHPRKRQRLGRGDRAETAQGRGRARGAVDSSPGQGQVEQAGRRPPGRSILARVRTGRIMITRRPATRSPDYGAGLCRAGLPGAGRGIWRLRRAWRLRAWQVRRAEAARRAAEGGRYLASGRGQRRPPGQRGRAGIVEGVVVGPVGSLGLRHLSGAAVVVGRVSVTGRRDVLPGTGIAVSGTGIGVGGDAMGGGRRWLRAR
jgi:hypothetical protein